MPEGPRQPVWFYRLPIDDQVEQLTDPARPLSEYLVYPLTEYEATERQQIISHVLWGSGSSRSKLAESAVRRLRVIRGQLDAWWGELGQHERCYLIEHRGDELEQRYAEAIQVALEALDVEPPSSVPMWR
jgi:hypothetical protein